MRKSLAKRHHFKKTRQHKRKSQQKSSKKYSRKHRRSLNKRGGMRFDYELDSQFKDNISSSSSPKSPSVWSRATSFFNLSGKSAPSASAAPTSASLERASGETEESDSDDDSGYEGESRAIRRIAPHMPRELNRQKRQEYRKKMEELDRRQKIERAIAQKRLNKQLLQDDLSG